MQPTDLSTQTLLPNAYCIREKKVCVILSAADKVTTNSRCFMSSSACQFCFLDTKIL